MLWYFPQELKTKYKIYMGPQKTLDNQRNTEKGNKIGIGHIDHGQSGVASGIDVYILLAMIS